MRIEGKVRESDYICSQYLHLRPHPLLAVLGLLMLALFVWVLIVSPSWVMAGVTAYIVLWPLVFIPWRAKRTFKQYKALSEPVSVEVRDDGLFFRRNSGEGLVPWSHIVKWRKSNRLILLYPASNIFHLIPSHFFSSSEAYSAFAEKVKDKVGKAK